MYKQLRMRLILIPGCFFLVSAFLNQATGQDVIAPSNPSITTDTLKSGEMVLGVNRNGGGVVNYLYIPGVGNIFGPQSVKYGRSGQSAIRDGLHGGRYNPTQAGFNETLGTPCLIEKKGDALVLPARPVALWYGDCEWDFTEWENIGADPDCYKDGGNSDVDEIDESELEGKQNTEVKSEFDYSGFYSDYKGKAGIDIACVRHYFEYRFARASGHCISQFRPGLPIYKTDHINPDISSYFPAGKHEAEPYDMSDFLLSWHMRNDVASWDPKYRFVKNADDSWNVNVKDRTNAFVYETRTANGQSIVPRLMILCDTDNPDDANALGFYMPESEFNRYQTIGLDERIDSIVYKDDRFTSVKLWDQARRIPTMAVYGFKVESNGILNRTRLDEYVYEAFRFDLFMLMGSPNEIWETVKLIEKAAFLWNFNQDSEGWNLNGNLVATVEDSALRVICNGSGQLLVSPDSLMVDARLQKFLILRIKNQTSDTSLNIRFNRYNSAEQFSQVIPVTAMDDDWKTYTLNMSKNDNWTGMINQIGIAFSGNSGELFVDMVAVGADGLSDCNWVFGGTAYMDVCGNCVGGNTGKIACEDCMGVPGGSAYRNDCGICVGGTSGITMVNEWPFNELSDWTLNDRLSGYASNGIAYLNITGNDPYMNYNNPVCIKAGSKHYLQLRVRNNANGGIATLYFQNDISNTWKFASFPVSQNDAELKSYTIDLASNPDWIGNIHKIRFDPPGTDGTFQMDYMALVDDDVTTSLQEQLNSGKLKIVPNPADGNVIIYSQQPSLIEVYTMNGQKIYQSAKKEHTHKMDVRMWNPGVYLVKSCSREKLVTEKMIVK